MRAVLDANVIASGVLGYHRSGSTPGEIVRRWHARAFTLVTSAHLVGEVARTLADPWFAARIPTAERAAMVTALTNDAELVVLTVAVQGVATHPEDDLVLATALSAAADYLVTGDKALQRLGSYQGVAIVSPANFVALLDQHAGGTPP